MSIKFGEDWEFNVLGIYNYNKPGKLDGYFNFVRDNHDKIPGDILEAGVYRGRSLLSMALLLKELGSDKKIYGFDSFSGFPPIYHEKDEFDYFDILLEQGKISAEHYARALHSLSLREWLTGAQVTIETISTSGKFDETSTGLIMQKAGKLGLDNIVLVDGPYSQTMAADRAAPEQLMAVVVDCDLYESYQQTFDFTWPRLSPGSFMFLDEYYSLKFPGGRAATLEFLEDKPEVSLMSSQKTGEFERCHLIKPPANN